MVIFGQNRPNHNWKTIERCYNRRKDDWSGTLFKEKTNQVMIIIQYTYYRTFLHMFFIHFQQW